MLPTATLLLYFNSPVAASPVVATVVNMSVAVSSLPTLFWLFEVK